MRKCGLVILLFLVIFAILFGGEGSVDTASRLLPPSGDELFGTDTLGRSLLERTAGGVGISLAAATAATVFSVVLGIVLSYLYTMPHFPKEVVLAVSDSMKSVPSIILALFLASVSGPGLMKLALAISVSHISDVSRTAYSRTSVLMKEGYIGGGMLPKLQNCIDAIENGVSRVHILDGRIPHCLLLEIFTNKGIGTAILNNKESRYYHGEQ